MRMKIDTTVTEVKENGKTYLRLVEGTEQLKAISDKAVAGVNLFPKAKIDSFLVKQDSIVVFPDNKGEFDLDFFNLLDDNFEMINEYAKMADCLDIAFYANEKSYFDMIVWLMDNINENWSQSPYGESFYSSKDIDWGYKPEGSLRVSDHWNFGQDGEHCPTAEPVDGWAVCKFENGKYHLIKKF